MSPSAGEELFRVRVSGALAVRTLRAAFATRECSVDISAAALLVVPEPGSPILASSSAARRSRIRSKGLTTHFPAWSADSCRRCR